MKDKDDWIPELTYQEGAKIPCIDVPPDKETPDKLFVWEFKQTGEFEPGPEGEDVPIFETDLCLFFNYKVAKKVLRPELLDELRIAFGLEALETAAKKGKAIIERVEGNLDAEEDNSEKKIH